LSISIPILFYLLSTCFFNSVFILKYGNLFGFTYTTVKTLNIRLIIPFNLSCNCLMKRLEEQMFPVAIRLFVLRQRSILKFNKKREDCYA
jgi:hypothetical protein